MQGLVTTIDRKVFSEISRDVAQVVFAAMVVGQVLQESNINWTILISGAVVSLLFWITSLTIINIGK